MKKNSLNVILDTVFSAKNIYGEKSHSFISYKIVKAVENLSGYDLDLFLNRAIYHPNFPYTMDFSLRTVFTIEQSNTIEFKNFISELVWYKHIFIRHKKFLNEVLSAKAKLEKLILFATGSDCIKYLDEIENAYGVSFWSIDARLLINKVLLNESNGLYVKSILSKTHNKLTEFLLQQLLFKHQVHNFDDYSKNLIKILDDMRTTQDNGYARNLADGISSFLIPLEFDKNIDFKNRTLAPFTNLPLIDQFIIFQRTISDLKLHGNGLKKSESSLISEINSFINNNYLNNILDGKERNVENIDENYKNIIRLYSIGDYAECISEINSVRVHKTILPLIEIYAKCHVYLDKKIPDTCIFNKITNWLISIIKCDRRAGKYIDEIELLASKIYFNSNSSSLFFTLYNLISDNVNKLKISRINLTKNGSLVTSLHLNITIKKLWVELGIKENEIPEYRAIKFKDLTNLSFDDINKHYVEYNDNVIIRSEYLKDYTNFLLENEKYELCIQFMAENCISNPANYYYFPIRKVINIVKDTIFDYASVALCILIDIFVKSTSNTSNELLLESYESLVDISRINRPSTYYFSKKLNPLEHYFLKFICIPSVMDSDPTFTGTDDLKKERIAIIDLLLKEHDDVDLLKEKDEIIDEISFEEIKTKYETGKIFVDIENLRRAKLERYRYYFDALKDSLILGLTPPEDFALITDDGNITAIPSGDTNSIIHELLKELISDFVKNENYGLDKYLSADIRHGVFENQLRSSAEKSQLITDMDGTGQYSKSNLIIDTYPLINPIINNEIGTAISEFSYHFDIELAKANSWFNVKTKLISESQQGMIDFLISVDMFNSFKSTVSNQSTFEKFFDACINFMWERTFRCLNEIKERLHYEFKRNVLDLIATLRHQIDVYRRRSSMREIQEKIDLLAENINKEIATVCDWLNVLEYNEEEIYKISSVMQACRKTFFNIHHCSDDAIVFDSIYHDDEAKLSYKEAKPLITSIITALNNAMAYGNKKIFISIKPEENSWKITIKNVIVETKNRTPKQILQEINDKIKRGDNSLNTKEGGAGIYKIYDLLCSLPQRFNVNHCIQNNEFILNIEIKNENSSC